jgi:hypothetical protein
MWVCDRSHCKARKKPAVFIASSLAAAVPSSRPSSLFCLRRVLVFDPAAPVVLCVRAVGLGQAVWRGCALVGKRQSGGGGRGGGRSDIDTAKGVGEGACAPARAPGPGLCAQNVARHAFYFSSTFRFVLANWSR